MNDVTIILLVGAAMGLSVTMTVIVVRMVREIHLQLNSRLDQLLLLTQSSSHAEGVKQERQRRREPVD